MAPYCCRHCQLAATEVRMTTPWLIDVHRSGIKCVPCKRRSVGGRVILSMGMLLLTRSGDVLERFNCVECGKSSDEFKLLGNEAKLARFRFQSRYSRQEVYTTFSSIEPKMQQSILKVPSRANGSFHDCQIGFRVR